MISSLIAKLLSEFTHEEILLLFALIIVYSGFIVFLLFYFINNRIRDCHQLERDALAHNASLGVAVTVKITRGAVEIIAVPICYSNITPTRNQETPSENNPGEGTLSK